MTPIAPRHPTRRDLLKHVTAASAILIGGGLSGCGGASATEVVLYTSVDQQIAAKVVAAFEASNAGVRVRVITDTEASKSVGLATRLRAEKDNPVCHVWWGNEVFHTIGLANDGLLASLSVPALGEINPTFKDDHNRWAGCGLRARVLAVSDAAGEVKGSIHDLVDRRFAGKVGLARPLAGTTGGHVAALYALWGEARADAFFRAVKANNAVMLGGNSAVAEQVAGGNLLVGLTDNDDVYNVQRRKGELWQVVLDQGPNEIGTLAMPTTVALVRRGDQPPAVTALAAFLLSERCERMLLDEHFAAYSVRPGAPETIKTMNVRFEDVAKLMGAAPKRAADILDGRA